MAITAAVGAVVGGVAALTGTTYSIINTENNRVKAEQTAKKMQTDQDAQLKAAEAKYAEEQGQRQQIIDGQNAENAKAQSDNDRNMQQSRQRKRAQAGQSFRDTVLTGPQGLQAGADTSQKKTLLGM